MKKLLLILLLATALMSSLALSACTSNPPAGSSASMAPSVASEKPTAPPEVEKESKGTLKIGMSWAKKNDPFMYAMDDTLTEAMAAMAPEKGYDNVEWIHVIANEDAQKQAADIEDLITQKVDLIVSFAYDNEAIKSSITSAHAAGIPFICYDRDVTEGGEQPDAFVGMDTTAQAYTTGVALFQAMKDEGVVPTDVISIIGALSDQNAVNRINGFKKAADEYGVTIKQEVPSEWNVNTALQGFSAAFQGNPNCNTVLLASDDLIASVQSVLEKAGKWVPAGEPGHIWLGAQDVFPHSVKIVQDGYIDFDTAYDMDEMAKAFAPVAYDLLEGKTLAQTKVEVSGRVVSKDNLDLSTMWQRNYMDK